MHYIEKRTAEPGVPLKFGKLIHAVLEELVQEHMESELSGPLSEERAIELYQQGWVEAELIGMDVFQEGLDIIAGFIRDQGELDHNHVRAVEKGFCLPVGRFSVLGYIDRVDWAGGDSIEIIDYKTNRMLFSREELASSLQLGLYALAAKELSPWVKKIKLTFWMLRHGIRMSTERTAEELAGVRRYVETMGTMIEQATEFPARINSHCVYCDHKRHCWAYAGALKGNREFLCEDTADIEAVAKEREEVANLAKVLYARKSELDGVRYKMFNTTKLEYPFEATLRVLETATGLPRDELVSRVAAINKRGVDQLVKETRGDRARSRLLKAELEHVASKSYSPRLWAKEISA
jgi:RecB family exonuclease